VSVETSPEAPVARRAGGQPTPNFTAALAVAGAVTVIGSWAWRLQQYLSGLSVVIGTLVGGRRHICAAADRPYCGPFWTAWGFIVKCSCARGDHVSAGSHGAATATPAYGRSERTSLAADIPPVRGPKTYPFRCPAHALLTGLYVADAQTGRSLRSFLPIRGSAPLGVRIQLHLTSRRGQPKTPLSVVPRSARRSGSDGGWRPDRRADRRAAPPT